MECLEHYPEQGVVVCQHEQPRRKFRRTPNGVAKESGTQNAIHASTKMVLLNSIGISTKTMIMFKLFPFLWVGTTYFFHENVANARLAAAAVKKVRDKTLAKKANRAKGFSYIDELFEHQPCMNKPVTLVVYDMTGFLQQCRYVELAGGNVQFRKS